MWEKRSLFSIGKCLRPEVAGYNLLAFWNYFIGAASDQTICRRSSLKKTFSDVCTARACCYPDLHHTYIHTGTAAVAVNIASSDSVAAIRTASSGLEHQSAH
jgi:hypothetical protein